METTSHNFSQHGEDLKSDRVVSSGWQMLLKQTFLKRLRKEEARMLRRLTIISVLILALTQLIIAQDANSGDHPKAVGNPALRLELLQMQKEDQAVRVKAESSHSGGAITDHAVFDQMERLDAKHTARMKEIVQQFGWPGKSLAGSDGATAAWLLVQHADADPKFQRHCLELMKAAAAKGEVSMHDIAYLTDRVLVNEGQKQVYGTQFTLKHGELAPRPIEDEANLDKRRKEAGLPPMEESKKWLKEHSKTPHKDKQ
jgi:hypothetical protein